MLKTKFLKLAQQQPENQPMVTPDTEPFPLWRCVEILSRRAIRVSIFCFLMIAFGLILGNTIIVSIMPLLFFIHYPICFKFACLQWRSWLAHGRGEWGDLAFGSEGSIDFLMGQNCNKILKKSGDVDVSYAHLKIKFHGSTTNG